MSEGFQADLCGGLFIFERVESDMPAFGKRAKEESINDKMVRLFKEGKSVNEISRELDVKPDVITNVIRRRCGEDSIPETVIRSKNAVPQHNGDTVLKADAPSHERSDPAPAEEEPEETASEGMSKLEKMMLEKDRKRQEAEAEAAAVQEEETKEEVVSMDGISTEGLDLGYDYDTPSEPAPAEEEPAEESQSLMEGISAADIPAYDEPAEEAAEAPAYADSSDIFSSAAESFADTASVDTETADKISAADTVSAADKISAAYTEPAQPQMFDIHSNGSTFDKMRAFAQSQIAVNNEAIAELEAKLGTSETDYAAELAEAEQVVEQSKVAYEEVIEKGDEINNRRMELQAEHRAALATAEEDYRRKLAELDEEYNNATYRANKDFAEKEESINAETNANEIEKETAKNNFLTSQSAVNDIKRKIADEVDSVKAKIESLKDENLGYEKFMA